MQAFLVLIGKLVPLYLIIALGYLAARRLGTQKETVASLLIYIIAPIVVFQGAYAAQLNAATLSLPVLFFVIGCVLCGTFYLVSSGLWRDSTRNILAFTAGTGNTGYFGLPVLIALFSPDVLPAAVLSTLGLILYENSVGFFVVAKGRHTARESIGKILRLPSLYAFLLGIALNAAHVPLGSLYADVAQHFRGAYTVLGMMMIGLGLGGIRSFGLDGPFIGASFLAKFVAWPLIMLLIIALDRQMLHLYDPLTHRAMLVLSLTPLAANSVAFATELRAQPEKAAAAVLLSTFLALFLIPAVVTWFLLA